MPAAVYVFDFGSEDRDWIRSALAGSVESIEFLAGAAELFANLPTSLCACLIVSTDSDAEATLQLVRELRARGSTIPVLVLGTHSAFREAVEIARIEATDFLERPVSVRQLRAAVRRACPEPK